MPCTIPCFTPPYTFIEHALGCKFYNSSNMYMVLAKGSLNCRGKTRQVWRMAIYRKWFVSFRRKLDKSPRTTVVLLHIAETDKNPELEEEEEEAGATREENEKQQVEPVGILLSAEDLAAIKVQACFRGHLARRAYRALKSLVKLQALVRGVSVRRQARIALHCMRTLVKLQVRVRTRQLLTLVDSNRNVQC